MRIQLATVALCVTMATIEITMMGTKQADLFGFTARGIKKKACKHISFKNVHFRRVFSVYGVNDKKAAVPELKLPVPVVPAAAAVS